ncbi:MAG: radical SAM protein [Planctomycetes bacterium]|nr:radical SAM protein [Planctomycetota bacterium]
MSVADFNRFRVIHQDVAGHLNSGRTADAAGMAGARAAASLSDFGLTLLARGEVDRGLDRLWQAFQICPTSRWVFHNFVTAFLRHNQLRTEMLDVVAHYIRHFSRKFPWLDEYRNLIFAPRFLNIQFVGGKCNLNCRMCVGTKSPNHTNRLVYLTSGEFERILDAAPTAFSVTMSSGDSDPLLHPELDRIIETANRRQVTFDLYTNGHALTSRICRRIVESQAVLMMNFSVDAATPETYRRIRGANFERVIGKIEMLQAMKAEKNRPLPNLSMSFVAMADNIQELPAFVVLAARLGADRVYVEHLGGWENGAGGNYPPADNPHCSEYVREAQRLADSAGLRLVLPGQLLVPVSRQSAKTCASLPPQGILSPTRLSDSFSAAGGNRRSDTTVGTPGQASPATLLVANPLDCCDWLRAVWVNKNGTLSPCCTVAGVCDMGNIYDGPLLDNPKYLRVKNLLLTGKVFKACLRGNPCGYVQAQLAAGRTPAIITKADLGELYREPAALPRARTEPKPPHQPASESEVAAVTH